MGNAEHELVMDKPYFDPLAFSSNQCPVVQAQNMPT